MPTLEIVTFRIRDAVPGAVADMAAFLAANAAVNQWLAAQPGFAGRQLARQEDGSFTDIVQWTSRDAALAAAAQMQAVAGTFELMGMIDPASLTMTHAEVMSNVGGS